MNFAKRAEELSDQIIKDRRYLHQHPELSYKEKNTTAYLVASLKELGIPVQTFEDYTGCIATIKGGKPGKHTVLLRGDIDALPIKENSGVEFESENEGVMHACGHDCPAVRKHVAGSRPPAWKKSHQAVLFLNIECMAALDVWN